LLERCVKQEVRKKVVKSTAKQKLPHELLESDYEEKVLKSR